MNKFEVVLILNPELATNTLDDEISKFKSNLEAHSAKVINEENSKVIILNFGALIDQAIEVAKDLKLTLIDMRFVKPLDEDILKEYLSKSDMFISIEDGSIMGGAGSAVKEFSSKENINIKSLLFGIPDQFIEHASREEMLNEAGLSSESIKSRLKGML